MPFLVPPGEGAAQRRMRVPPASSLERMTRTRPAATLSRRERGLCNPPALSIRLLPTRHVIWDDGDAHDVEITDYH
jgi:hypothetical protein